MKNKTCPLQCPILAPICIDGNSKSEIALFLSSSRQKAHMQASLAFHFVECCPLRLRYSSPSDITSKQEQCILDLDFWTMFEKILLQIRTNRKIIPDTEIYAKINILRRNTNIFNILLYRISTIKGAYRLSKLICKRGFFEDCSWLCEQKSVF